MTFKIQSNKIFKSHLVSVSEQFNLHTTHKMENNDLVYSEINVISKHCDGRLVITLKTTFKQVFKLIKLSYYLFILRSQ